KSISEATESDYSALHAALDDVFAPLQNGELDPQIYYEGDTPVDVTPLPLEEYSAQESVPYSSFNKALDVYFSEIETSEEEATTERPDFEAQIEEQQRIIEQQQQAIENFEQQAAQERKKAESLYEHYNVVDELLSTIQEARANDIPWEEIESRLHEGSEQGIEAAELVNTINEDEGTVTIHLDDRNITLDCSMGVEQNANQLYQEAKRIESKKEGAKEAIEETREELEQIKSRREQWESEPEQKTNEETEIDWLERSSIPVRQHDHWYDRFRWFHTSDGFLVLGGRNASQNEELVEKYMDKYDLFFHTQAYGAPATILKKTGPSEPSEDIDVPDQSIFEAAQFAVSYSSLWKEG
ncbi:MAG: NFACT RNA binding domain-containing protein, partial [Halobacteriaceae archaeon]